jgi:hypothetical protein
MMGQDESGEMAQEQERDEKFRAQTSEQFEALGRFVGSFALLVDAVRTASYFFLSRGDPKHGQLVNVVLFHQSMTANPLFEIMRGLYAMLIVEYPDRFKPEEVVVINSVLLYCAREYGKLANLRNDLLHGTWHIGWASPDQQDFSTMHVQKFRVGKTGYKLADGLPQSAEELRALAKRCDDLTLLLNRVYGSVLGAYMAAKESRVRFNVRQEKDRWLPEPPNSQKR